MYFGYKYTTSQPERSQAISKPLGAGRWRLGKFIPIDSKKNSSNYEGCH